MSIHHISVDGCDVGIPFEAARRSAGLQALLCQKRSRSDCGVKGHPYELGFDLRRFHRKLEEPLGWEEPRFVFRQLLSDLFHDDVPVAYIQKVARVMVRPNGTHVKFLTKRSERMRDLLATDLRFATANKHIWWGVSVEDRNMEFRESRTCVSRMPPSDSCQIEPLLEDLGVLNLSGIDWNMRAAKAGHGARPMEKEWVVSIRPRPSTQRALLLQQWGGVQKSKHGRFA